MSEVALPGSPLMLGLPYARWWPHQQEAIEQVAAHFARGIRTVVLEAPTGIGKSGIAVGLLRHLRQPGLIVVSTKALQDQYDRQMAPADASSVLDVIDGGKGHDILALVKGRNTFPCAVPLIDKAYGGMDMSAEDCIHGDGYLCDVRYPVSKQSKRHHDCGWFRHLEAARKTPIVCTNYDFLLHAGYAYPGLLYEPDPEKAGGHSRSHVVMDEAHLLESHVCNWTDLVFTDKQIARMGWPAPEFKTKPESWRIWAAARQLDVESLTSTAKTRGIFTPRDRIERKRELARLNSWESKLRRLATSDDDNWVFDDTDGYKFMPVWVGTAVEKALKPFHHSLLMTATVLDKRMFCWLHGLDSTTVGYVKLPSVYSPANRPVYYEPVGSMARTTKDAVLPRLVKRIQRVMDEHGDSSGVIHTNSYELAAALREQLDLTHHKLFMHVSANRAQVLADYMREAPQRPCVLISPSMTTGVSFDGDAARWQVIAKIPWPYLGDKRVNRRYFASKEWYAYRTAADLIQTTGRIVRSTDDFGESYILDSDFTKLGSEHGRYFPDWWRTALVR